MKPLIQKMRRQIRTIRQLASDVSTVFPTTDLTFARSLLDNFSAQLRRHLSTLELIVCPNLVSLASSRHLFELEQHSLIFQREFTPLSQGFSDFFDQLFSDFLEQLTDKKNHPFEVQLSWKDLAGAIDTVLDEELALYDTYDTAVAMPPWMANSRRNQRIACQGVATVEGATMVMGEVKDLSLEGVYLQVPLPLPEIGRDLKVCLRLPGLTAPVETMIRVCHHGELVWSHQAPGMGATFLELAPVQHQQLASFLGAQ